MVRVVTSESIESRTVVLIWIDGFSTLVFNTRNFLFLFNECHLLHFAVLDLPEVEDADWGSGAHADAEGDEAALGGEEHHLPHGELLVQEVSGQLHTCGVRLQLL